MNIKIFIASFIILVLLTSFIPISKSEVIKTVKAEKESDLGEGFKIRVEYEWKVSINAPLNVEPGSNNVAQMGISDGRIKVSLFIPFPINNWVHSDYFDYSVGSEKTILIPITQEANAQITIKNFVLTKISISDAASVSPTNLKWNDVGNKKLTISVSDDAKEGDKINLLVKSSANIVVDVSVNIGIISFDVTSFELGEIEANPNIEYTIGITVPKETPEQTEAFPFSPLILVIIIAVIIAVIALFLFLIRKK